MSNRFNLLSLIFFSFLIFSGNTSLIFSQSPNPPTGTSYKVHVGDTARYNILKITMGTRNYDLLPFSSRNGDNFFFNITKGDYLNLKVSKIDSLQSGSIVYSDVTYFSSQNKTGLPMVDSWLFIKQAFDSKSDLNNYIEQYPSSPNYSIHQNGDILTSMQYVNSTTGNISGGNDSDPILIQFNLSFNWKTGWVESIHNTGTLANGSPFFEIFIQGHPTTDFLSSLYSYAFDLFVLGLVFLVIAVIVILVLSYRSYTRISTRTNNSRSFFHYLSAKFLYGQKDSQKQSITTTDEALQTIESILNESKEN